MAYKFRSQTAFSAGALSKLQQGRHDSKVYAASVKEMENIIPVPDGPAIKRPGTYFAAAAASNTANGSRLVPFYFGEGQAYILEFYADNLRILTGDGLLDINGTTNPFVVSSTGYDATKIHEIDFVQSADVLYITHKDVPSRSWSAPSRPPERRATAAVPKTAPTGRSPTCCSRTARGTP